VARQRHDRRDCHRSDAPSRRRRRARSCDCRDRRARREAPRCSLRSRTCSVPISTTTSNQAPDMIDLEGRCGTCARFVRVVEHVSDTGE
jgi:hypothetical protein